MPNPSATRAAALFRGVFFLLFWALLSGAVVADLPIAVAAAIAATWVSLRLLPPGRHRVRPRALAVLALRFLGQSFAAGADVARRVLSPDMKLRPGFAHYTPELPAGPARSFFLTVASLQPGTVSAGWDRTTGALMIHCLDTGQPVAADMAIEEGRMAHALGYDAHGGDVD